MAASSSLSELRLLSWLFLLFFPYTGQGSLPVMRRSFGRGMLLVSVSRLVTGVCLVSQRYNSQHHLATSTHRGTCELGTHDTFRYAAKVPVILCA